MTLDEEYTIPEQKYCRDFTDWRAETMTKRTCPNNLHFIMYIDLESYVLMRTYVLRIC